MHTDYIARLLAERAPLMQAIERTQTRIFDHWDMLTPDERSECFKDMEPTRRHIDAIDDQVSYYRMLDARAHGIIGIGSCKPAWTN